MYRVMIWGVVVREECSIPGGDQPQHLSVSTHATISSREDPGGDKVVCVSDKYLVFRMQMTLSEGGHALACGVCVDDARISQYGLLHPLAPETEDRHESHRNTGHLEKQSSSDR